MSQHLPAIRDLLKSELHSSSVNVDKCSQLLLESKMAMVQLGAYIPSTQQANVDVLVAAREILEMGGYYSIRIKDINAFERYVAQLYPYYYDLAPLLPPSPQMFALIGLNLLRLLSQNRLSDFHTALESIDPEQLQSNQYIKQAVDLEQHLMEGSYNKVWNARNTIQGEEFMFFYDILINTIRNEIASCSEKAYESLSIQDACASLSLKNTQDLLDFANDRGWKVNPAEQMIFFNIDGVNAVEIPQEQIIAHTLAYAKELERIV